MKKYDILVIGHGSGGSIVEQAVMHGMKTALVNAGPLGGTCLNVGCIPSKMILYPADRIMEIKEAKKLGIKATIDSIDVSNIMERMRAVIKDSQQHMQGIETIENLDYYHGEGSFIDNYVMKVGQEKITAKKIFIGSGARPYIPPIKGLDQVPYYTNENIFDINELPSSIIIVGGGYIAVEFAHFFSAMGTEVTIIQRSKRLINQSEPEISETLEKELSKRMKIVTNREVVEVSSNNGKISVVAGHTKSHESITLEAEKIMIAAGRASNADRLMVQNTGVEVDERGYIAVNSFLETSKENIWAFGDATGKYMFKHVANEEAWVAWNNAMDEKKISVNYHVIPSAIFTYPQIASVGLTQEEAQKDHDILIGHAHYQDVAKGEAMVEKRGFTKAIIDAKDHTILGFHIIGPHAAILIQEVINAMALGGRMEYIGSGMHIHPALSELILRTLGSVHEPFNDSE